MIDIEYKLKRSLRRRTISIHIQPDGSIRVLAPASLTDEQILDYVKTKRKWIESKIAYFKASPRIYSPKKYRNGTPLYYLGKRYRLKIIGGEGDVRLMSGQFLVPVPDRVSPAEQADFIRRHLLIWYAEHGLTRLQQKTLEYAEIMACYPRSVMVKNYKSRWGCCFADGRIIFNWRLSMAPVRVIDYVVVHELAHLIHRNHSKRFWNVVESVVPDYKDHRRWLRNNGHHLQL